MTHHGHGPRFTRRALHLSALGGLLHASGAQARRPTEHLPKVLSAKGGRWDLSFEEYFLSSMNDQWRTYTDRNSDHESERRPESVVQANEELGLQLRRNPDRNARQPWIAGYVRTKNFRQQYGYFECEMRIANEQGVNNAFWLMSDRATEKNGQRFELDIVEAHFPNAVQTHVRQWAPEKKILSSTFRYGGNLAERFHRYGMLWLQDSISFYFDDQEIFRTENDFAHSPAEIRLSNVVAKFAGRNDGDVEGAATSYGWVRAYRAA
ncbi:glycoside hydrolase family 16 protein [Pseudoroseomonas ludipueritiae]|uniref:Glycoside hydrolase family 16 protein n=1 Tax=Pseudoroseomonas ludipueritiae TaxID=198093 RepID=A0ABR7RD97_9PROT|nr:glycoside hydrolase family 16 protein [Pseudoroseomonas ludipueritiae]MBC9179415.1 glycoside hydrolase family 16 protein [Pseudoroseomonas ludipueritiae]